MWQIYAHNCAPGITSALEVLFVDCAGAYYQPQPAGTTVIVNTDPMMGGTLFPPDPMQMTCPNCHQSILTRTQYELGMLVWLVAAMLCIVGYVVFVRIITQFCVCSRLSRI